MGPRCTAVWQVRTKAGRMICDDGKQMTERREERNAELRERSRERSDHGRHRCQCEAHSYAGFSIVSRGHWGANGLPPPNRKLSLRQTAKSKISTT